MRPIVFNIFIVDLFLVIEELHFASCRNNNNIYCSNDCASDDITLFRQLRNFFCGSKTTKWKEAPIHLNWFLTKKGDGETSLVEYFIKIQHAGIWSDEDVQIDQQPNFHDHVNSICDNASNKLKTLGKYHIRLLKKEK